MSSPHEDPRYSAYAEQIRKEAAERERRRREDAERKARFAPVPVQHVVEEQRAIARRFLIERRVEIMVLIIVLLAIGLFGWMRRPAIQAVALSPFLEEYARTNGLPAVITNSLGMVFRLLPPATITLGSPDREWGRHERESLHAAIVPAPIYMAVTETTADQFESVMGTNPCFFAGSGERPAESMTWENALRFCNNLSVREGLPRAYELVGGTWIYYPKQAGYRLPMEVEWEYACRAGTLEAIYSGPIEALPDGMKRLWRIAWFNENSGIRSQPVAQREPNPWGLYDMLGNVAEWCWDWYQPYSEQIGEHLFAGPAQGAFKIVRGGSWLNGMEVCRAAAREFRRPDQSANYIGFRCVLPLEWPPRSRSARSP